MDNVQFVCRKMYIHNNIYAYTYVMRADGSVLSGSVLRRNIFFFHNFNVRSARFFFYFIIVTRVVHGI